MSKQINKNKPSHKFDIGGDFGISGTLQFANGLASNSKERKANEETYNSAIDNTRIGLNGISSLNNLDSLEDYLNSAGQLHELETSDLIGNNAHRIGKFLSTSSQAMQAGSNFGPWGALAGAVVGQIGAGIAGRRNRKKAESAVADLNEKIRQTNALQTAMVDNKLNNIMANQIADQQWDYIAALGGNLHSNSTTWSNGLNYIGSGGSHESNPNDGVAISTAPDGLQNKVEEGEVVWNDDYVFSKRLKVPKKDLEKNKWKGKTYADVAKKLMEDSEERPNDPITLRGLDDALSRLRDSQDELKAKQEERKIKKEIASMPPEMLAQLQQQAQQPTEEEIAQQAAMEQQQMPMVDSSMPQPTMKQPPMYAKGGRLFPDGGPTRSEIWSWGTLTPRGNTNGLIASPTEQNQLGFQLSNSSFDVNDIAEQRMGKNSAFRQQDLATRKAEHDKLAAGNGINKGALFGALASGIDMTGAVINNQWGYKGGNLDALYKGKQNTKDLPKWLTGAWDAYTLGGIYSKGGHLFKDAGNVKAISGKGFFTPLPQPQMERIDRDQTLPSVSEVNAVRNAALTNYINRQSEYVNVNDAQRYGGFYNNVDKVNEYLNGNTPMDVNNIAQGVANQQSRESGRVYLGRIPVKKNYGLDENSRILDRDSAESIKFFLKKNPNLNLDSDAIYFYSKDKNDEVDKNKFLKADKVDQEIYDKNSVENVSRISGINFDRSNMKAKGGHLHAEDPSILRRNQQSSDYPTYLLGPDLGYNFYNPYVKEYDNYVPNKLDYLHAKSIGFKGSFDDYITYRQKQFPTSAPVPNAKFETYRGPVVPITRTEEEVEDETEADVLNDRNLLLRAKEKYYPKSLTKDERKELRQIKKGEKEPKERNWNFDETNLRYAPVWGSIFNVARGIANRPDYNNPERIERAAAQVGAPVSPKYIGDYLQYRPLDESYYLNQLNAQQNAANNNIIGLSNGNRSMALASMLMNDYNYNNQRGNAYRQGLEYNDVNRLRFGEFNRGTNQFNAQQHLSAAAQSAQNKAHAANLIASAAQMREGIDNAYGASQSANWTSLFNNLGAVGKDKMNWNMAKDIYDYQTGRNGEVKYRPAAKGGYLTIKTNNRRKE